MSEKRHTVLIIDDDEGIIDLLTEHFSSRNCETIATDNPTTVVDKLRNLSVRLMLLDLKMRELDGFAVLDKIKDAGLQLPPTLIITGFYSKYEGQLKSYGIREEDVIRKPFTYDALENSINRKLGKDKISSDSKVESDDELYKKNRCKIAFVEDEEDLTDLFDGLFSARNYQVYCYNDGTKALEGLKQNPVDIALIDIKLPGIQGDQIIKELAGLKNCPFIIPTSADPLTDDVKKILNEIKCDGFIEKPFDLVRLVEMIKTVAIKKGLLGS